MNEPTRRCSGPENEGTLSVRQMSRSLCLCALLSSAILPPLTQGRQRLDFSGIDRFWPVYNTLTAGHEPSRAAWDSLFATPGYAALEARERRRAAIEQAMRVALMPGRAATRDSVIRAGGFTARAARHLAGLPAARESLAVFERELRRSDIVETARRAVSAFLPQGLADSVPPPPIALIFFADDGRGYPSLVIADLLRLARTGLDTGFFAHELFHFYRRRFAVSPTPRASDAGIVELLAYPAEEGVADQLDKRRYVETTDDGFAELMRRPGASRYAAEYRAAYRRAGEAMARVSAALEHARAQPDSANAIARVARDSLPDAGRALGAFMAHAIDSMLGRQALISAAGDTFRFWHAYDRAAIRAAQGVPRLSARASEVIRRVERTSR